MKIGIIGAMAVEVEQLKKSLKDARESVSGGLTFTEGLLGGTEAVIVQSGVGKVNAALCAQRLILQYSVGCIINTGIAGAMASGLQPLDFVASTDALYHDMDATAFGYKATEIPQMGCSDFKADPKLISAAKNAFPRIPEFKDHKLIEGRIASGDQFISDKATKEKIKKTCNPSCVEMEGAAIAHAAYLNQTPFVIIRCMSDLADDSYESTYSFNEETAAKMSASLVLEMCSEFSE
ncbi:MAG: 5'-methylthioadenosine/adenosylhomocysteine nucleosidase [Treponema sp.]|nr:5'-methylthioadenosine/adenosylhomocysteine nucleosidase [Treponema sp.]